MLSVVRLSPLFTKQNNFQAKTMFTTGESVGLAEWIIDDTCIVYSISYAAFHYEWNHCFSCRLGPMCSYTLCDSKLLLENSKGTPAQLEEGSSKHYRRVLLLLRGSYLSILPGNAKLRYEALLLLLCQDKIIILCDVYVKFIEGKDIDNTTDVLWYPFPSCMYRKYITTCLVIWG